MQQENSKNNTLGHRLRKFRMDLKLNQLDFGIKLGLDSQGAISKIENNERRPSSEVYEKLAEQFTVDLHWLITGHNSPVTEQLIRDYFEQFQRLSPYIEKEFRRLCKQQDEYIEKRDALEAKLRRGEAVEPGSLETIKQILSDIRRDIKQATSDIDWLTRYLPSSKKRE